MNKYRSKIILFLILINIYFLQTTTLAQPQLWEIYSTSDQPFINVTVDRYESDSLYIKSANQLIALHQDSIRYIIKRNESQFGLGFLFGGILGVIFFNAGDEGGRQLLFSEKGYLKSTIFGLLFGGTIGGLIGLAVGVDTEYNFEELNTETKRKILNRLFLPPKSLFRL